MTDYQLRYANSHALIVGIDHYADPRFMPLGNAEKDAREFGDILAESPFKFSVQMLLGEAATRQAVLEALYNLRDTDPDDRILVYFAGHGYTLLNRRGHETGYLACADTLPEKDFTALTLDEVTALRDYAGAKHIGFIFDACFSGQALGLTRAPSVVSDKLLERRAYQVMSAGAADQTVSDYQSMTQQLLRELRAGLSGAGLDLLTFNSLGLRVQQLIVADSKSKQFPQFGHLTDSQGGDFLFLLPDAKPKSKFPKQDFEKARSYADGPMSGRKIGLYDVGHLIGRGDMADVYLAQAASVQRYVALKVFDSSLSREPSFEQRFVREMSVLVRLENSYIVPVYDFGMDEGVPYIVMRYLSGGSFAEQLSDQAALPPQLVARVMRQIAEGLDYAHGQNLLHLDVKPSNILRDGEDNYSLADFGIAAFASEYATLSGTGIVGTPAYMAPEFGMTGTITNAADIYALGVTAFQALSGDIPYKADTPMGVLIQHMKSPVPDVRDTEPNLSEAIANALKKAMAKTPEERFTTAIEFARALTAGLT